MGRAFENKPVFNQPLASWDVSGVYDASDMFGGALSFNLPLGAWDVKSVELAHRMFRGASHKMFYLKKTAAFLFV
jgi:hypothetical protein